MLLQAITLFNTSVLTFLTVGLSQVLSDTLPALSGQVSKAALSGQVQPPGLCVCSSSRIRSHPLSSLSWQCVVLQMLAHLHHRCQNRCHGVGPHKIRPLVQAGAILCSRSRGGRLDEEGWVLQAVRACAYAPPLRASHHSHIGQGAHASCGRHWHYSIQHARVRADVLSRGEVWFSCR